MFIVDLFIFSKCFANSTQRPILLYNFFFFFFSAILWLMMQGKLYVVDMYATKLPIIIYGMVHFLPMPNE